MSPEAERRGGVPVATYDSLPEAEQVLVSCLRLWSNGPEGRDRLTRVLCDRMGAGEAGQCRDALADMVGMIARHGLRRMVRHRPQCCCVGADEAVFAHVVMVAATGAREDAMLLASLMLEASVLLPFVEAAAVAGLYLHRATLTSTPSMLAARPEAGVTLH